MSDAEHAIAWTARARRLRVPCARCGTKALPLTHGGTHVVPACELLEHCLCARCWGQRPQTPCGACARARAVRDLTARLADCRCR